MLRANDRAFEGLGFEVGDLQDLLRLLDEGDVPRVAGLDGGGRNAALDHLAQTRQVHIESFQDTDGRTLSLPDDTEQKVLDSDVIVPQPKGFFPAVSDDVLHAW